MNKKANNAPIDFVIIWVDGSDPAWIQERQRYKADSNTDSSTSRFRDWDNLQYWFRGVEKFAPWVNKIHFVTWGHLPSWLNVEHPKLNIVRHEDYIPSEYLPTFSSHTIELNLHRIKGLSENFVYFNDDMFLIDFAREQDFFKANLPCDSALLNVHCYNIDEMFILAPFRDVGIINKYYSMKTVIKSNFLKWFNYRYGASLLRNIYLLPCPRFPGFLQQHLPTSFKKQTFVDVWEKEYEILNNTCKHRFRHILDVNQWLFKEWQLASGKFYPRKVSIGKSIPAYHLPRACQYIKTQKGKLLCFNDVEMTNEQFEKSRDLLKNSFNYILPYKSSYER